MGAHHSSSSSSSAITQEQEEEDLLSNLTNYVVEQRLVPGSGRMLKTYRVKNTAASFGNLAVVKTMYIHSEVLQQEASKKQQSELRRIKQALRDLPHVAPFLFWKVGTTTTSTAAAASMVPVYVMRTHVYTTLSDRLACRPFLHLVEKLWVLRQVLLAVQHMHDAGVVHGFLTTENIGLTSWNYVVLLDVASYKHVAALPDDDPSLYLYYFQEQLQQHHTTTSTTTPRAEKRCYLAPERFYTPSRTAQTTNSAPLTQLTPASDIFSVGCCMMELFLNGERAMDLGDLMEYRQQGNLTAGLQSNLNKIESSSTRAACRHMLHLNPKERLSAREYLQRLEQGSGDSVSTAPANTSTSSSFSSPVMPKTFDLFADFFEQVTCSSSSFSHNPVITPDARIAMAAAYYDKVLFACLGIHDDEGQAYFERILGDTILKLDGNKDEDQQDETHNKEEEEDAESERNHAEKNRQDTDMDKLMSETQELLDKLAFLTMNDSDESEHEIPVTQSKQSSKQIIVDKKESSPSPACESSLLLYLQLILVTIRHVQRPSSKFVGLQLLQRLGLYCTDDARLQRIVPTTIVLLHDQDALVRASAIRVLTWTLARVQSFAPSDSKVFPQYIFKRVSHLLMDEALMVRIAFSECIPLLAETSLRFLDISHAVRLYEAVGGGGGHAADAKDGNDEKKDNVFADDVAKLLGDDLSSNKTRNDSNLVGLDNAKASGSSTPLESQKVSSMIGEKTLINNTYNVELGGLHEMVSRWVVHIATDQSEQSSPPKLGLLQDLPRLCNFFGRDGVIAFILPQILAFLNDRRDWQLRASLFEHLPSLCFIVGRAATEHFVLPCLETALVDGEDLVMSQALLCLASLVELGLLSRSALVGTPAYSSAADNSDRTSGKNTGLFEKYAPLLLYPSAHVRHGAIKLVNASCVAMGFPDRDVFFVPVLRPFLRFEPSAHHLTTPEGLMSCLVPPWTKKQLRQELDHLDRLQTFSPTSGKWTSIGIDVQDGEGGNKSAPDGDHKAVSARGIIASSEQHVGFNSDQVANYLRMLSRSRKLIFDPLSEKELFKSRLANAIEGNPKLAQHIRFPNQKCAGRISKHLPLWYNDLRDFSLSDNSYCSESCGIRSVSTLSKVYGLSLMDPSTTIDEDKALLDASLPSEGDIFPDDKKLTENDAKKVLMSPESKIIDAASAGEWGAEARLDPSDVDTMLLTTKLKGLRVPPLSPKLGVLREHDQQVTTSQRASSASSKDSSSKEWRPKSDALLASSSLKSGHSAPVSRLAVAKDQGFFVSGSHDGTCRVWELRQAEDSVGILESSLTYSGHSDDAGQAYPRINDIAIVENSHSVVSGASDGAVHVWRVDVVSTRKKNVGTPAAATQESYEMSRVSGSSVIRKVDPMEGEVLAVSHFNTSSASILSFATQKGLVHSWDLRSAREPFVLKHRPDIGYLTSMSLGNDRHWVVTGTSRGYLALWDVRFQQMVKLWQHSSASPVNRLATSFSALPRGHNVSNNDARPYVFAACGPNECSMFDIVDNTCRQCFRVIEPGTGYMDPPATALPSLREVPIATNYQSRSMRNHRRLPDSFDYVATSSKPRMTGMVGSVGGHEKRDYLITGGSDCQIRYFDFLSPSKCYTISGGQQRPTFERIDFDYGRLITCRENPALGIGEIESSRLPRKLQRGLSKPQTKHHDSITDLKMISYPMKTLLSCSGDGAIKLWR